VQESGNSRTTSQQLVVLSFCRFVVGDLSPKVVLTPEGSSFAIEYVLMFGAKSRQKVLVLLNNGGHTLI